MNASRDPAQSGSAAGSPPDPAPSSIRQVVREPLAPVPAPLLTLPEARRPKRTDKPGVVITDIRIPFGRMTMLILKASLASLPAILVMALIGLIVALAFACLGGY